MKKPSLLQMGCTYNQLFNNVKIGYRCLIYFSTNINRGPLLRNYVPLQYCIDYFYMQRQQMHN
uniref:Uncharacterized protein n=1 Tax=Arundo donax TaxID=35708 RepID=A0A0A9AU51_ARUDO